MNMKEILLYTRNNSFYRNFFLEAGYMVADGIAPTAATGYGMRESPPDRVAVIEISDDSLEECSLEARRLCGSGIRVVCIAAGDTDRVRGFLLREGIADLLPAGQTQRLVESVAAMEDGAAEAGGSFIALDDCAARLRIMRSVAERFNFEFRAVGGIDEFFAVLGNECAATFVNLGAAGFEINRFIRLSHACGKVKLAPFIPYKDACEGIFVHEMISGLNRLTRVILSPEEMLSFMVGMLFRKSIVGPMDDLARALRYPDSAVFARESFGRLYFTLGMEAFELAHVLGDEDHARMRGSVSRMQRALVKADGVRWLVRETGRVPTCGVSGA